MSTAALYHGSFCHHALTTELDHVKSTFGRTNQSTHQSNLLSLIDKVSSLDHLLSQLVSEASNRAVNLSSRDFSQYNYISDRPVSTYLEKSWDWILESTQLAELHVKNAAIYQQYYQKLDELKFCIQNSRCYQSISTSEPFSVCDIPCWADPGISHLQITLHSYGAHSDQLMRLLKTSRALIPVYLRTHQLKVPRKGIWLCRYESPSELVKLEPNDSITILDTSDTHIWKIQTRYNQILNVPAMCCLITGPDYQAMDKTLILAEDLIYNWRNTLNQTWPNLFKSINMVIEDILCENVEIDPALHNHLVSLLSDFDSVMIKFMQNYLHDNPDPELQHLAVTETWLQNLDLCFTILENDTHNQHYSRHSEDHYSHHHRHRNWGEKSMSHINMETIDLLRKLILLYKEHFEAFDLLCEAVSSNHTLLCDNDPDNNRNNRTDFQKIVERKTTIDQTKEQSPHWPITRPMNDKSWLMGRKKSKSKISKFYCQIRDYNNYHQSAISILPRQEEKDSVRRTRHLIQVHNSSPLPSSTICHIEVSKMKMLTTVEDSVKYESKYPLKRSDSSTSSSDSSSEFERSSISNDDSRERIKITEKEKIEPEIRTLVIYKSQNGLTLENSSCQTGLSVTDPDDVLIIENPSSTRTTQHHARCDCAVQTIHFGSTLVTDCSHYDIPKCSRKTQTIFYKDVKRAKEGSDDDNSKIALVDEEIQTKVSLPPFHIDHEESKIHEKDIDKKSPHSDSSDFDSDDTESNSDITETDQCNKKVKHIRDTLVNKKRIAVGCQTNAENQWTDDIHQSTQTIVSLPPIHIDREESKISEKDKDKIKKKSNDDSEDDSSCPLCSDEEDSDSDVTEINQSGSKLDPSRHKIWQKKLNTIGCQTNTDEMNAVTDDETQTNVTLPPRHIDHQESKISEGDKDKIRRKKSGSSSHDDNEIFKHLETVGSQTLCSLPTDWTETDEVIIDETIISKSTFTLGKHKACQIGHTNLLIETSSQYERNVKESSELKVDIDCQTDCANIKMLVFGSSKLVQCGSGLLNKLSNSSTQTRVSKEKDTLMGDKDEDEDGKSVSSSSDDQESIPDQEDFIEKEIRSRSNTEVKAPIPKTDYKDIKPGKVLEHKEVNDANIQVDTLHPPHNDECSQTLLTVPTDSSRDLILDVEKDDFSTQTLTDIKNDRAVQAKIRHSNKEIQASVFTNERGNIAETLIQPQENINTQTIEINHTDEEIQATPNVVNNAMNVTIIGGPSESKAQQCRPTMADEEIDAVPELMDKDSEALILGGLGVNKSAQCFVEMANREIQVRPTCDDVIIQVTPPQWMYRDRAVQNVSVTESAQTMTERRKMIDNFSSRELKFRNKKEQIRPVAIDSHTSTTQIVYQSVGDQTDDVEKIDFGGIVRSGDLEWGIDQGSQMETNFKILAHMQVNVQKLKVDSIQILEIEDETQMN